MSLHTQDLASLTRHQVSETDIYGTINQSIFYLILRSIHFTPGKKWEHDQFKNETVGNLLNFIDNKYGLAMPVFIFGYTKMCRGISFRSNKRVPTHMVMSMGKGHNCSTIIQTIGRGENDDLLLNLSHSIPNTFGIKQLLRGGMF